MTKLIRIGMTGLLLTLAGWTGAQSVTTRATEVARTKSVRRPPADALRATAVHQLQNHKLAPWERMRWQQVAAGCPVHRVTVWATQYGLWDRPRPYKGDDYHLASNKLPLGTVVYLPMADRLMVVMTTGADSNDGVADGKGAHCWVDVWTRREGQYGWTTQTGPLWIVGKCAWQPKRGAK